MKIAARMARDFSGDLELCSARFEEMDDLPVPDKACLQSAGIVYVGEFLRRADRSQYGPKPSKSIEAFLSGRKLVPTAAALERWIPPYHDKEMLRIANLSVTELFGYTKESETLDPIYRQLSSNPDPGPILLLGQIWQRKLEIRVLRCLNTLIQEKFVPYRAGMVLVPNWKPKKRALEASVQVWREISRVQSEIDSRLRRVRSEIQSMALEPSH